jgi:putative restriction endonuclease
MISNKEITEVINSYGFEKREGRREKSQEYYNSALDEYVYIHMESDNNYNLVIHPERRALVDKLSNIQGVKIKEIYRDKNTYLHGSGYRKFPKKIHKGKDPIHYGIPFGFNDDKSIGDFMDGLVYGYFDGPKKPKKPAATEKDSIIKSRCGQGAYRNKILKLWGGCCAVTGFSNESILRASHARPWKASDDIERLDVYNGFPLVPNLDAAFDKGYITFEKDGRIRISNELRDRSLLGINDTLRIDSKKLHNKHEPYLTYHRQQIYEKWNKL